MYDRLKQLFRGEHGWVNDNLSAYLDDVLNKRDRAKVARHLASCASCRADLEGLEHTINLLRLVPAVPLPRSFLVPLAEAQPQAVPKLGWAVPAMRTASALVTLLFVIALSGNLLFQTGWMTASAPEPEMMITAQDEPVVETEALAPSEEPVARSLAVETAPVTVEVELPVMAQAQETVAVEKEIVIAERLPPEAVILEKEIAAMNPEPAEITAAQVPEDMGTAAIAESPAIAPEATLSREAALQKEAAGLPPAVVTEAQAADQARAEPVIVMEQRQDTRQRISEALQGIMWALLVATVVLWAATAILTKQRL